MATKKPIPPKIPAKKTTPKKTQVCISTKFFI